MELLFGDPYYDSKDWDPRQYATELAEVIADVDPNVRTVETNVGHGADFPSVLVEFLVGLDWSAILGPVTAGILFFQGKRINENLDGWIDIAKKIKSLIKRLTPTRLDEKAAVLLVLDRLAEAGEDLGDLEISTNVIVLLPGPTGEGTLDKRPDAVYSISVEARLKAWLFVIKSDGKELYSGEYPKCWLGYNDI